MRLVQLFTSCRLGFICQLVPMGTCAVAVRLVPVRLGQLVTTPEISYIKNIKGRPANLNTCDLLTAWNNEYMKSIG